MQHMLSHVAHIVVATITPIVASSYSTSCSNCNVAVLMLYRSCNVACRFDAVAAAAGVQVHPHDPTLRMLMDVAASIADAAAG